MELYKKYRPNTLDEIIGNKETVNSLKTLIQKDDLPHTILLTGKSGCGKTTVGRILKNELNIASWDYKELDTAIYRGIDSVRDIKQQMLSSPIKSKYKIFLLDEAHMIGRGGDSSKNEAQNALLKALEDTPKHIYFILCTTNPEMLLKTIKGRCTEFKMNTLNTKEMMHLLKKVQKKEKQSISIKVIKKIIKSADGHPRNALQLLGKVIHLDNEEEMLELVSTENIDEMAQVNTLCQSLLKGESWNKVSNILKGLKHIEAETLRRNIIGYANTVLLNGNDKASLILGWFLYKNTYDSGFALIVQFCWNICNEVEPNC